MKKILVILMLSQPLTGCATANTNPIDATFDCVNVMTANNDCFIFAPLKMGAKSKKYSNSYAGPSNSRQYYGYSYKPHKNYEPLKAPKKTFGH